jgi:RNA polymerase sigma-70 factor (ECF subfamily)
MLRDTAPIAVGQPAQRPAPEGQQHEAYLLRRVEDQDLRAFEDLYRLYHPRLTRFLSGMVRQKHLVEDALNDTMMVVWNRPGAYDGTCKVSTWVFAIAYRTALKTLRRWKDVAPDLALQPEPPGEPNPEQRLGEVQVQAVLKEAVAQLTPDHKTVVELAYFHEFGYREIAEIMECPVDTVKTRMFHARRKLRKLLGDRLPEWA